ncbi:MAG: hypothetical protein JNL32_08750 [Candidatus Kapabacteria bacterium]|nr:hypothetical protein [Candidatus Kapabacteria bacterium]
MDILREGTPVQQTKEAIVRIYALVLRAQTAVLTFDKFDIDDATTLYAYDTRRTYVYGALASNNMRPGQPFVLRVENVDTLILECTSSSPIGSEQMHLQTVTVTSDVDNPGDGDITAVECLRGVDCEEADEYCVERTDLKLSICCKYTINQEDNANKDIINFPVAFQNIIANNECPVAVHQRKRALDCTTPQGVVVKPFFIVR